MTTKQTPTPNGVGERREAARNIVATITKQNWKNGGVLEVDTDVAVGIVDKALYAAEMAAESRMKTHTDKCREEEREAIETAIELLTSAHVATDLVWKRYNCVEKLKALHEKHKHMV